MEFGLSGETVVLCVFFHDSECFRFGIEWADMQHLQT